MPDEVNGRHFPSPWSTDEATESFCIRDANRQALAYALIALLLVPTIAASSACESLRCWRIAAGRLPMFGSMRRVIVRL